MFAITEDLSYMMFAITVRQSRLCQKEKEQSRLSKAPDRNVGESQGEREQHLRREIGSMEKKGWTIQ